MIYIYDLIGAKSGCMYYNDAFCKAIRDKGINVTVVSNYKDEYTKSWLANMYNGIFPVKHIKFIYNFMVLILLLLYKNNRVIYLSYGTKIDLYFLKYISFFDNLYVDIHEYVQLSSDNHFEYLIHDFNKIYKRINLCIYHSPRTESYLNKIDTVGRLMYVPHFKYFFDKTYREDHLLKDITESVSKDRINCLFFGHFRENKGIRVLMDAINSLHCDIGNSFHFIFAGSDPHQDFTTDLNTLSLEKSISVVARYIETEELNYLFSKSDIIILPYFDVSQSGVLETAVFFRKQLILSDIVYFSEFIKKYPSFGYLFNVRSSEALTKLFSFIKRHGLKQYEESDLRLFYQKDELDSFMKDFCIYLNSSFKTL